ncbi:MULTISPECIES: crosslink repair DNA glycosylase YcaQ family protein [unclassified Nonomuraea]|uniref:DNA glycosylase AlkZ-like family protein n=1 Tax=unclassified Nonomuraea TaxID=2593643 RepID=UPI0033E4E494
MANSSGPEGTWCAPVRLLPAYDNALLGHADRSRIIDDADRKQVPPAKPESGPPCSSTATSAAWSFTGDVRVTPFRAFSADERQAVDDVDGRAVVGRARGAMSLRQETCGRRDDVLTIALAAGEDHHTHYEATGRRITRGIAGPEARERVGALRRHQQAGRDLQPSRRLIGWASAVSEMRGCHSPPAEATACHLSTSRRRPVSAPRAQPGPGPRRRWPAARRCRPTTTPRE